MAKKTAETKNRGGRPPKELCDEDAAKIEDMASEANTWEDIATSLGWSKDTLQKKELAKESYQSGCARCRRSIRRMQYEIAMGGDVNMLKWLGKILCGQKEVQEIKSDIDGAAHVSIGAYKGDDE